MACRRNRNYCVRRDGHGRSELCDGGAGDHHAALLSIAIPIRYDQRVLEQRWNCAAGEFLRRCCFAPLARYGAGFAMSATFAISAVGHALLAFFGLGRWNIALVFGAFFLVQPLLIAAERRLAAKRWRPAAGRVWTLTALAITSPMVVEPALQFLERSWGTQDTVLLPTLAALGFIIILSGIVSLVSLAAGQGQAANGDPVTAQSQISLTKGATSLPPSRPGHPFRPCSPVPAFPPLSTARRPPPHSCPFAVKIPPPWFA